MNAIHINLHVLFLFHLIGYANLTSVEKEGGRNAKNAVNAGRRVATSNDGHAGA